MLIYHIQHLFWTRKRCNAVTLYGKALCCWGPGCVTTRAWYRYIRGLNFYGIKIQFNIEQHRHKGNTFSPYKHTNGVFTGHRGAFLARASSLRFPHVALHLFTWYHNKISWRRESPRREFTPVVAPGRKFHSGTYEISQRYHVNVKWPLVSVWHRFAGRLERVAHA